MKSLLLTFILIASSLVQAKPCFKNYDEYLLHETMKRMRSLREAGFTAWVKFEQKTGAPSFYINGQRMGLGHILAMENLVNQIVADDKLKLDEQIHELHPDEIKFYSQNLSKIVLPRTELYVVQTTGEKHYHFQGVLRSEELNKFEKLESTGKIQTAATWRQAQEQENQKMTHCFGENYTEKSPNCFSDFQELRDHTAGKMMKFLAQRGMDSFLFLETDEPGLQPRVSGQYIDLPELAGYTSFVSYLKNAEPSDEMILKDFTPKYVTTNKNTHRRTFVFNNHYFVFDKKQNPQAKPQISAKFLVNQLSTPTPYANFEWERAFTMETREDWQTKQSRTEDNLKICEAFDEIGFDDGAGD